MYILVCRIVENETDTIKRMQTVNFHNKYSIIEYMIELTLEFYNMKLPKDNPALRKLYYQCGKRFKHKALNKSMYSEKHKNDSKTYIDALSKEQKFLGNEEMLNKVFEFIDNVVSKTATSIISFSDCLKQYFNFCRPFSITLYIYTMSIINKLPKPVYSHLPNAVIPEHYYLILAVIGAKNADTKNDLRYTFIKNPKSVVDYMMNLFDEFFAIEQPDTNDSVNNDYFMQSGSNYDSSKKILYSERVNHNDLSPEFTGPFKFKPKNKYLNHIKKLIEKPFKYYMHMNFEKYLYDNFRYHLDRCITVTVVNKYVLMSKRALSNISNYKLL